MFSVQLVMRSAFRTQLTIATLVKPSGAGRTDFMGLLMKQT